MPVSRTSTAGICSMKDGALWWMGHRSASWMGSPPSMGSPNTFSIRPRVFSPTGTWMPLPVAVTLIPRASPSLAASMMHRTRLRPICWAVSMVSVRPSTVTVSASWSLGR